MKSFLQISVKSKFEQKASNVLNLKQTAQFYQRLCRKLALASRKYCYYDAHLLNMSKCELKIYASVLCVMQ